MADFSLIKEQVTIEAAAQLLGLELRTAGAALRGPCPACQSGGARALVVTPSKQLFYCFAAGIGGDLITMWGHISKCSLAEAGRHIADQFGVEGTSAPVRTSAPVHSSRPTAPQAPEGRANAPTPFDPVAFAAKLTYGEEVAALGFSEADAERFSVGLYRGQVYILLRNEDGSEAGWVGVPPGTKLKHPPKWLPPREQSQKVVRLVPKTA